MARAGGPEIAHPSRTAPDPRILSETDRSLYEEIFALQERGAWHKADHLIKRVNNRVLMGHVLAQRYLHPTRYRSKYNELAKWMQKYADHYEARRIYRLALRRKPRNARAPRQPASRLYPVFQPYTNIEQAGHVPVRRNARKVLKQVRRMVNRQWLTKSTRFISLKENRKHLSRTDYDLARTIIASGWFFYGNAEKAFRLADAATRKSGARLPYARWIAGLSAYRLGKFIEASNHLEALSRSSEIGGWDRAGAAFWAARANMKGQRPHRVNLLLRIAAREQRTFYGLIARRWLGQSSPFDWTPLPLNQSRLQRVRARPAGRRVLALVQVGQYTRADRELRTLIGRDGDETAKALIAVATAYSLPASSYRAGAAWSNESDPFRVKALYPVPGWEPRDGYKLDRALIFAVMRQESAFHARARSHAGAVGLMQLMPATASFISGQRFSGSRRHQLYDPRLNMSLAQKYMIHLLEHELIQGDLLRMAIAYNGGPGNLQKWLARAARGGYTDPLMFIESLPARETRIFVERVLASLWMYRDQFGQDATSLTALAGGNPGLYRSSEQSERSWARNVRD